MRRARSVLLLAVLALLSGTAVALPGVANADLPPGAHIFADFNNDGITDVATLNPLFTKPCTVTLQDGAPDGTFGPPTVFTYTPPPEAQGDCPSVGAAVKVGDDKLFDLVVTWGFTDVSELLVLKNPGFQAAGTSGGIIEPDFIHTADLNGDGRQDLIVSSNQVNELATFFNNADGTFTRGINICSFKPQYALADFNGDGAQDILLSDVCPSSMTTNTVEVLYANGRPPAVLTTDPDPFAKLTAFTTDVNYDGIPDAGVITQLRGTTTVQYFVNDGHGNFTPFTGNTFQGNTITADLNNDGIPDVATLGQVGDTTTCTVTVRLGTSSGTLGRPKTHEYTTKEALPPFCPSIGVAVKLGRHKKPDLVTAFPFGFDDMMVVHHYRATAVFPGVIQPDWIRAADLNSDGRPDIIAGGSQEETLATFVNNRDGTLSRGPIAVCAFQSGTGPQYVLADFNGDHGQDILLADNCPMNEQTPERAEVLFGNGQTPVTLASSTDATARFTVFALDVNYDGIPDAGVLTTAGGTTGLQFFHNDGHGVFTPTTAP